MWKELAKFTVGFVIGIGLFYPLVIAVAVIVVGGTGIVVSFFALDRM